jgi:LEA14-like dessication related protein
LVVVFLVVGSSGCITEPAMKLYGARVAYATPTGVGLNMTMKVENDNAFDIQVRNVAANVTMAERYRLPTVYASPNIWLPAGRSTLVQIPVLIPWSMIAPLTAASIGSSTIGYRVVGRADVTATRALAIDFDAWKLDQEGKISRGDLIMAAGRGILSP